MADDVVKLVAEHAGRLTPTQAVDYVAVTESGYTQAGWAQTRGVTQQAISKSVAQARDVLDD
jgi:hypothetical protein